MSAVGGSGRPTDLPNPLGEQAPDRCICGPLAEGPALRSSRSGSPPIPDFAPSCAAPFTASVSPRRTATRLAVLAAARDLSVLPSSPPIGFRPVIGAAGEYAVDLGPKHRLRFFGSCVPRRRNDLAAIDHIEVLGIEQIDIASGGRERG